MGKELEGIFAGLVTPFDRNGDLLEDAYRENVEYQVKSGVHGLVALAVMGEAPSLSFEEKKRVIDLAVGTNAGRLPILVGVGGTNARETFALIDYAESAGADGLFVVTPYFYRYTRSELIDYFREISRRCMTQIMIYNSTYVDTMLDAQALADLAQLPNVTCVKEGNPLQVAEVIRLTRSKLRVFSSRDVYLHEIMALGGAGGTFICANVAPRLSVETYQALKQGDYALGFQLQSQLMPLMWELVAHSFPAGCKAAMNLMGLPAGHVRFPLLDYNGEEIARLRRVMQDLHVL